MVPRTSPINYAVKNGCPFDTCFKPTVDPKIIIKLMHNKVGFLCWKHPYFFSKVCSFILIHQIFCGDKHDEKRVGTRLANCPKTSTFYPPLKQATATLWLVFWNIVQKCETIQWKNPRVIHCVVMGEALKVRVTWDQA